MARRQDKLPASTAESVPLITSSPGPGELPRIPFLLALLYPLYGTYYLFAHPVLFRTITPRLPLSLLISLLILAFMFTFTYLPQLALVAIFKVHGPLAFLSAALMVLSESGTLISFVLENFVLEEPLVDVFDAVLVIEGYEDIVKIGRVLRPPSEEGVDRNVIARLGEFKKSPFVRFSCGRLIEWALELPLNIIPIVGPALFIILQGYRAGPISHYHYYQLLNLKRKERRYVMKRSRWQYLAFGAMSLVLQVFPVISTFFVFTTAIGAALWAVRVERMKAEEQTSRLETV